jgi:hypothetical protein
LTPSDRYPELDNFPPGTWPSAAAWFFPDHRQKIFRTLPITGKKYFVLYLRWLGEGNFLVQILCGAAAAVERWYGPDRKGFQTYAAAFHAAWADQSNAELLLAAVASNHNTPAFARASALTELAPNVSPANVNLARAGLSDSDPMVRIGALDMLANLPPSQIWPLVSPLLSDASRGVRIKAADLLAAVPTANQPSADRTAFERAAAEFVAAQHLSADRPQARSTLGTFYARRGLTAEAEAE